MVRDLNVNLRVVVCDTRREPDGLAMSSRNIYLSKEERAKAPAIYKALSAARAQYEAGETSRDRLLATTDAVLRSEPGMHSIQKKI